MDQDRIARFDGACPPPKALRRTRPTNANAPAAITSLIQVNIRKGCAAHDGFVLEPARRRESVPGRAGRDKTEELYPDP
ncbi:MAG TPA: hypothetical protein VHP37_29340 [Burkholderiales bacterium]|nr:hypothetical protein [Burkholderiales bacterium]